MAFDGLDITIGGDSAGAKGAIASVRSSLSGLDRSANDAQDSVEELGDSVSGTAARMTALGASAGATAASLTGLSTAGGTAATSLTGLATTAGTLSAGLVGVSAVAAPLAATLGTVAAAAGGLATAFGAVIGSGILAFGEKRAQQNKEELRQVNQQIKQLKQQEKAQGSLNKAQQKELKQLKAKRDGLKEATSAGGALKRVLGDLVSEIKPLIVQLGQRFIPLIEDAVAALPSLVKDIIGALGPLTAFKDALRDFGAAATGAIPKLVSALVDLGRRALPFIERLATAVGDNATDAFDAMIRVTELVGDDLLSIGRAVGSVIPDLTELGVIIIEAVEPAVVALVDIAEDLIERFNAFARSGRPSEIFAAIRAEIIPLIPRVVALAKELRPLLSELVDNLPEIIRGVGAFADSFLDLANLVADIVAPPLRALIDIIGDISQAYADWVERSEESEKQLAADIKSIKEDVLGFADSVTQAFNNVVDGIISAFNSIDFSPLVDGLNTLGDGVNGLIRGLNKIPEIDIDFKVPSVDEVAGQLLDGGTGSNGSGSNSSDEESRSTEGGAGRGPRDGTGTDEAEEGENEAALDPGEEPAAGTVGDSGSDGTGTDEDEEPGDSTLNPNSVSSLADLADQAPTSLSKINLSELFNPFAVSERKDIIGLALRRGKGFPGFDGDFSHFPDDENVRESLKFLGVGEDRVPGLATGGLVDATGAALLHEGERVVPAAQVEDRGSVTVEMGEVVSELRGLREAVERDATISDRDLVRGLERVFDRHGGTV